MKKIFYALSLAAALIFTGGQAYSQPCATSKPCPCTETSKPCPCPTITAKPCPCQNPASSNLGISDALNAQPCFKTFSRLLQHADIAKVVRGKGPYTVFAPTDEAFCKLPKGTVESLMCPENKCTLEKILRYHIVNESIPCDKLTCPSKFKTSEGGCIEITPKEKKLFVNDAEVIQGDICTKSGKIYTIDTVLSPSK